MLKILMIRTLVISIIEEWATMPETMYVAIGCGIGLLIVITISFIRKRVYCKHCRYNRNGPYCGAKKNRFTGVYNNITKDGYNTYGNCEKYSRKWYCIWATWKSK